MSLSIKDLVRILCAGGSFVSGVHEAGFYIIAEDKNELSELRWVGSQLASETFIGSGVRHKSPVVYVTRDNNVSLKKHLLSSVHTNYIHMVPAEAICLLCGRKQCTEMFHTRG